MVMGLATQLQNLGMPGICPSLLVQNDLSSSSQSIELQSSSDSHRMAVLVGSGALSVVCSSALEVETRVEKVVGGPEVVGTV